MTRKHLKAIKRRSHLFFSIVLWLAVALVWAPQTTKKIQAASQTTAFRLDILDDGKQLKLLAWHPEIGSIFELWCYEGGPFRYGAGSKREDGSVVFVHISGKMTATTTFTPMVEGKISMDILVEGPLEELKKVNIMGPCMQFWHSDRFKRENTLVDFAERCFLYSIRGPVGMMDTGRGPMKDYTPDSPENNPPCTQWYVPIRRVHPGDIWAFGASGDRPIYNLVGVGSRDGKWLAAIGCTEAGTLGQGWHDCIHHVPQMQSYLNEHTGIIRHGSMIYVMANDKNKLLESFRQDFPIDQEDQKLRILAGKGGVLKIAPHAPSELGLDLSLNIVGAGRNRQTNVSPGWKASPWGGFVRGNEPWRMWALPNRDTLEIWISMAGETDLSKIEATWSGKGWTPLSVSSDVPALVRQSPDGSWIAALAWEQSEAGQPSTGVVAAVNSQRGIRSARGRVFVFRGDVQSLRDRWLETKMDWAHSRPYYMPLEKP
jgi:hypothetical protein